LIRVLFTTRDTPLGRAIRFLTNEPVSHVAIQLDEFVVHSTIFGPEVRSINYFNRHNKTIFYIDIPKSSANLSTILDNYDTKFYDYACLIYLGIRYMLLRYMRISLPKVNLWNISGMYTCTELATALLFDKPDPMITPYKLYLKLSEIHNNAN
jgi:hypothetical protein